MYKISEVRNGKKYEISILHENGMEENPRLYNENGIKMIYTHKKYINLGDMEFDSPDSSNWNEHIVDYFQQYEGLKEKGKMKDIEKDFYISLYSLHDHSGVSLSLGSSRGWDCGVVGFIYKKKKKGYSEEDFYKDARQEIKIQSLFLNNEFYDICLTIYEVCECCGSEKLETAESYYYSLGLIDSYDLFNFNSLKEWIKELLDEEIGDSTIFSDDKIKMLDEVQYVY